MGFFEHRFSMEKEVAWINIRRSIVIFYWLKTSLQRKFYGMVHCPYAESTCFSTFLAISLSLIYEILSRFQCMSIVWQSGFLECTLPLQHPGYQRKQSACPWTSNDSWPFCSWRDCCFSVYCHLVFRSCVNIQVSSHVITSLNKRGWFCVWCSAQICWSYFL